MHGFRDNEVLLLSPTYLSSVLHAYTPITRSLRSSSAHLLVEPVSELHLLLVAFDLLDNEFRTLYQITSNLLPLSPRSDPDSKLTSLLQLDNNWPQWTFRTSDSTLYSILRALQMFYITLLQAGYDVIAISPPGSASGDFSRRILKERP